jgi:uncharacterized protein
MAWWIFKVFLCSIWVMEINRTALLRHIRRQLSAFRAVELVGPRQVGKTTLAREFVLPSSDHYFDLEDPRSRERLMQSPMDILSKLKGLVVIDEIQHAPRLPEILRVLIDRPECINTPGQYLLLGSASPALMHKTESLLGRAVQIEISGFDISEVGTSEDTIDRLWLRGGFPEAYLAASDDISTTWRTNLVNRYLYNDLPQLGINVPAPMMMRFWQMVSHFHGQVWNGADLAKSLGIGESTVRRYLDYLTQTFMIRQLQPWYENLGKRQVKSPKIYFRDSGLLHLLMGIQTLPQLVTHGRSGASWEGFALEQVLRISKADEAYFWATHASAELDLLLMKGRQRIGVEFKRADAPKVTPSMRIAGEDLKLDKLYVVYPGPHRYTMAQDIEAVPLWALLP